MLKYGRFVWLKYGVYLRLCLAYLKIHRGETSLTHLINIFDVFALATRTRVSRVVGSGKKCPRYTVYIFRMVLVSGLINESQKIILSRAFCKSSVCLNFFGVMSRIFLVFFTITSHLPIII